MDIVTEPIETVAYEGFTIEHRRAEFSNGVQDTWTVRCPTAPETLNSFERAAHAGICWDCCGAFFFALPDARGFVDGRQA